MQAITFRLEDELYDRLRELAYQSRVPMNTHANAALMDYLDIMETAAGAGEDSQGSRAVPGSLPGMASGC